MRCDPGDIIRKLKENNGAVRQTARDMGICPGTVIFWRKRARSIFSRGALKARGLKRKSTKPHRIRATILTIDERIEVRKLREERGLCAVKIKSLASISRHHNTIHRFMRKQGLVDTTSRYRRPRYQETTHMYVKNVTTVGKLQMDVKYVTPELSGLPHTLFLYAVIDIFSRYKQGVMLPLLDQGYAIQSLKLIRPFLPFTPDFIQTDNGLEFQSRFYEFVTGTLRCSHHYIHKSNPNENAVIERSFRTDEEEFFLNPSQQTYDDPVSLNAKYQEYLDWYNTKRPHLSLNLKTPLSIIKECSIC